MAGGITPPASRRTVRDILMSYGSHYRTPEIQWVWLLPSDHPLHRVVQHINLDNAAPSLPSHYRTFNTTTGNSAPIQHIGIHPHSQTTACLFPLHCWTGSHVPYQRLFIAHAAYTPTACLASIIFAGRRQLSLPVFLFLFFIHLLSSAIASTF